VDKTRLVLKLMKKNEETQTMFVSFNSNTTGTTSGTGTGYPSGAQEFLLVFSVVRVALSVAFCVVFCRLLFLLIVHFYLTIAHVLSVLRFTASSNFFCLINIDHHVCQEMRMQYIFCTTIVHTYSYIKRPCV